MEKLLQYWPIIGAVIQALMLGIWWVMTRKFVTVESCATCRRQCRTEVAEDIKKLPSVESLASLAKGMEGLRGDLKAQGADIRGLAEVLKRVERPLDLLLEHQLAEGRRERRGE